MAIFVPDDGHGVVVSDWDAPAGHAETSAGAASFGLRGLGVVRVQVAPEVYVASLPMPVPEAITRANSAKQAFEAAGSSPQLVAFEITSGFPCWIRGRDVVSVDVVPTEDPSA